MGPRSKPLLIYDGDCGFCLKWVQRWCGLTRERVEVAPYQEVQAQFPQILKEQFESAVQLVEPSGPISLWPAIVTNFPSAHHAA